jgi:CRISPR system Cascade subunit CasE
MFLTRVPLDTNRRETLKALNNLNMFHGALASIFQQGEGRILWRIDKLYDRYFLYILSPQEPDCSHLIRQFGNKNMYAETKNYEILLDKIDTGSLWRFKLVANPTYKKDGKVYPHKTVKYQEEWLEKKSHFHGFSILPDTLKVSGERYCTFKKGSTNHLVSFLAVTYDGILKVENADLFKKTLVDGIGREKTYGCGLLTIMKG